MASQGSKANPKSRSGSSSKSKSRSGASNGRGSSSKAGGGDGTPRKPGDGQGPPSRRPDRKRGSRSRPKYDDYAIMDPGKIPEGPDLLLDVPVVKVDEINLELDDLRAQIAVSASVRKLVQLSVGADVRLGKVEQRNSAPRPRERREISVSVAGSVAPRSTTPLRPPSRRLRKRASIWTRSAGPARRGGSP